MVLRNRGEKARERDRRLTGSSSRGRAPRSLRHGFCIRSTRSSLTTIKRHPGSDTSFDECQNPVSVNDKARLQER